MAGLQGRGQFSFIDHTAAGDVENTYAGFHRLQTVGVDQIACLIGQRHMTGDEIRLCEKGGQTDQLDAALMGVLGCHVGIIGDHAHAQRDGSLGDFLGDAPEPDGTQHFVAHFNAHELAALPLAGAHVRAGRRDVARQRHQHGDGVLGRGDHIARGRIDHGDARLGGRFNVDVVNADAGAADDTQLLARPDHLGGRLGGAAHEQGVVVADDLDQLLRRQIGADVDLKAVRFHKRGQAGFGQ